MPRGSRLGDSGVALPKRGTAQVTQERGPSSTGPTGPGRAGSKAEGPPGVVKAVRVCKADVAAGRHGLSMAALHPHDRLGNSGLTRDCEATHAAGGPSEGLGVDPNGLKCRGDHGGDESGRRGGAGRDDPGAIRPFDQFGKEGWADSAALSGTAVAVSAGPGAGNVHEEAKLVVDVKLGVGSDANISDPANAYVHVSEAHTTHIWIDICVCI